MNKKQTQKKLMKNYLVLAEVMMIFALINAMYNKIKIISTILQHPNDHQQTTFISLVHIETVVHVYKCHIKFEVFPSS